MRHLAPEELIAYRDGELKDQELIRHMGQCEVCRSRLLDTRLTGVLIRTAVSNADLSQPDSDHPSEETMAAYFSDALKTAARADIERHLSGCRRCVEDLAWLREIMVDAADPAPRGLVEQVKRREATRVPRLSLGTLIIEQWGSLKLQLHSWPAVPLAGTMPRSAAIGSPAPGNAVAPMSAAPRSPQNPSSARARRQRQARWFKVREPEQTYDQGPASAAPPASMAPPASAVPPDSPALMESRSQFFVEIDTGSLSLLIRTEQLEKATVLAVKAQESGTGNPANDLELRISQGGTEFQARTGSSGEALLPISAGPSILVIESDPPVELEILNRNMPEV